MDGRQDRDGMTGQERRLGRGTIVCYLSIGSALAISRVALYLWVDHRYITHTVTETVVRLIPCFYPEALLADYARLGSINVSRIGANLMWGSLLTLGSFIMATPILLVGWLIRRRR